MGASDQTGGAQHHCTGFVIDLQGGRGRIILAGFFRGFRGGGHVGGCRRHGRGGAGGSQRGGGNTIIAMRGHRYQTAVGILVQQHGTSWCAICGDGLVHLIDHHTVQGFVGDEDALQLFDALLQIVAFGLKFDTAHLRQAAQTQVENILRLNVVQIEYGNQSGFCGFGVIGGPNHLNDLVDIDHGQQQAFDQMQALQRLPSAEFATAANHHTTMIHPHLEHFLQSHGVRTTVDQSYVVDGEIVLQGRVPEQLCQHGVWIETGLDLDDQPCAVMSIRQVDRTGNALQFAILHTFGNTLQHTFRSHHERQFRHDNGLLACRHVFDMRHRTGGQCATAALICLANAAPPHDYAAAWPIRTWHIPHQILQRGIGVTHQMLGRRHDFAEIMRGHVRGHADRDAGTAIDQQIRNGRGQNGRLLKLVVIVGGEIDGVLGDVRVHAECGPCHTRFGVAGCRRPVIKGTEIAVAIHQGQTHRERLGETHHGLVDCGITMRMELAHHLADHTCRFHIWAVGREIHLAHLVDDAALHGLETVPGVRQCTRIDH